MSRMSLVLTVSGAMALGACVSMEQKADVSFTPPQGDYSLIVMRPDVTVGSVTLGGLVEPRAEWTDAARANLLGALKAQQAGRGGRTTVLETRAEAGANGELVADLERLHNAVGASIQLHKYSGQDLPTKRRRGLEWTLGQDAVRFGKLTGHDYALFMYAEDSFASTGRAVLGILGTAGCFVGFCAPLSGGRQLAYASLVDLKSGDVVWFNVLQSQLGDIRTPAGAAQMVERLLGRMKAGREVRKTTS